MICSCFDLGLCFVKFGLLTHLSLGDVAVFLYVLCEDCQPIIDRPPTHQTLLMWSRGAISLTIFPSQFKFDGNLFHSHLDSNTVIATKFCTWHDSCAVVACAKICCDLMASNGVMARPSFHRIQIAGKKTLVKGAPVLILSCALSCLAIVSDQPYDVLALWLITTWDTWL